MSAANTALPFGVDGYESFVSKGACRQCGRTAYFKQKCQRCHRKFCSTCAPRSLQKYGEEPEEECCIGCEPFLVVAPDEAEPIFELEPESENVSLLSSPRSDGHGPIHVPLSAVTFACEKEQHEDNRHYKLSPPVSYGTLSTYSDDEGESGADNSSVHSGSVAFSQSHGTGTVDFLALPSWNDIQERLYSSDDTSAPDSPDREARCDSHSPPQQEAIPRTPPSIRSTATLSDLGWLEPPLTPDSGCCTACRVYSSGKKPCPTCGTKYCHESACQVYLFADGSCAKCSIRPRTAKIPALPVEAGCCTACRQYSTGKEPCETCGMKYCQEAACQAYLFSNGTCGSCHGNT